MPYAANTALAINKGPRNTGNNLGRAAVRLEFSVLRLAKATGATRQTVYNWLLGNEVTNAYRARVERLTEILNASRDAEQAWRAVCSEFGLNP